VRCDGCLKNKDCTPYYCHDNTFYYCDECAIACKADLWTTK